jgi:SAM-dependent methyltransferase
MCGSGHQDEIINDLQLPGQFLPVIRFGRLRTDEIWAESRVDVLEEALALMGAAFAGAEAGEENVPDEVFVEAMRAGESSRVMHGQLCRLEISGVCQETIAGDVCWIGGPSNEQSIGLLQTSLVQCSVRLPGGEGAAGVLIQSERIYRVADMCRALENAFDTGCARQGRYAVLASDRGRQPTLRPFQAGDFSRPMAQFHCDNPHCRFRGIEVLVKLSPGQPGSPGRHHVRNLAYPCPACPGLDSAAWALTFDREVQPGETGLGQYQVVEYHVNPRQKRSRHASGPIDHVVGDRGADPWGTAWNPETLPSYHADQRQFLDSPRLPRLLQTIDDHPETGNILATLLDAANLRSFVSYIRRLPRDVISRNLAAALAQAYSPRRTTNFKNLDDHNNLEELRYHYIAFLPGDFLDKLRFFDVLDHPGRFLDVGCGIGEKSFLAYALGKFGQCDGLEINPGLIAVAEFLLHSVEARVPYPINVFHHDALTFGNYGDYDVVYMYRPFSDRAMMGRLISQIAPQLAPGAMLFDVIDQPIALRRGEGGLEMLDDAKPGQATWTGPVDLETFLQDRGFGGPVGDR